MATAANVQYVMKELKTEFEKETGKEIRNCRKLFRKINRLKYVKEHLLTFLFRQIQNIRKKYLKKADQMKNQKFTHTAHWHYGRCQFRKMN